MKNLEMLEYSFTELSKKNLFLGLVIDSAFFLSNFNMITKQERFYCKIKKGNSVDT